MAKRGRPTREPTAAEREKVKELQGEGAPISDIARLLKRSVPNLRKYFSLELKTGKQIAAKNSPLPFKITDAVREKVALYIGCKMMPEDVARAIGVTLEQLQGHFGEELQTGAARARAKVLDSLSDQMASGMVGATNRLEVLTAITDGENAVANAPGYTGKKAAAKVAASQAVAAGGKFAPRPAPRLVAQGGTRVDDGTE